MTIAKGSCFLPASRNLRTRADTVPRTFIEQFDIYIYVCCFDSCEAALLYSN